MRVGASQSHATAIHHPLLDHKWPRPYTPDEYPRIIELLQLGDSKIRERTITSFIPLLGQKVCRYCHALRTTRYSDELMSAGMLGIVTAIDRVQDHGLEHENLGGYVVSYMHQFLSKCVEGFGIVRVPGSTIRTWKQLGRVLPERLTQAKLQDVQTNDDVARLEQEYLELVYTVCTSHTEREIARMRFLGFNDTEIAAEADVSRPYITQVRQAIAERLQSKLETQNAID